MFELISEISEHNTQFSTAASHFSLLSFFSFALYRLQCSHISGCIFPALTQTTVHCFALLRHIGTTSIHIKYISFRLLHKRAPKESFTHTHNIWIFSVPLLLLLFWSGATQRTQSIEQNGGRAAKSRKRERDRQNKRRRCSNAQTHKNLPPVREGARELTASSMLINDIMLLKSMSIFPYIIHRGPRHWRIPFCFMLSLSLTLSQKINHTNTPEWMLGEGNHHIFNKFSTFVLKKIFFFCSFHSNLSTPYTSYTCSGRARERENMRNKY